MAFGRTSEQVTSTFKSKTLKDFPAYLEKKRQLDQLEQKLSDLVEERRQLTIQLDNDQAVGVKTQFELEAEAMIGGVAVKTRPSFKELDHKIAVTKLAIDKLRPLVEAERVNAAKEIAKEFVDADRQMAMKELTTGRAFLKARAERKAHRTAFFQATESTDSFVVRPLQDICVNDRTTTLLKTDLDLFEGALGNYSGK